MADLQHILGNIFKDIAQARVTSDIYSRNISKYYEQDPLLRKFPLPRTEINEVEVDLKFILSGLELAAGQDENQESSAATLFVQVAREMTDGLFEKMFEATSKYPNTSAETLKKLKGTEHRIYLSQSLLLYLQRNRNHLLKKGKFDVRHATGEIGKILRARFDELLSDSGLAANQLKEMEKAVFKKLDISGRLEPVKAAFEEVRQEEAEYKPIVEVTADRLAEVPDSSISSIKVKAHVRNYIWSKVEHEGETWRSLNPE